MKTLIRIMLSSVSILMLPDCFAASYEEILQQFQKENRAYSSYELLTRKHPDTGLSEFVAGRGDVDGDGLEEVVFAIQEKNDKDRASQRIVILKGLENKQFKTLLINQPMAGEGLLAGSYYTLYIDKERARFSVSSHSGGFMLQAGPGSTKTVEFGLSGTKLPIKKLSYSSPWRTESAVPAHSYTYSFDKLCYVQEWEAIEYNPELKEGELVGKIETGRLSLVDNKNALYIDNNTDPFSTNDKNNVVPAVIDGRITKTPDQSPGNSWEC